jgi:Peptidase family M28
MRPPETIANLDGFTGRGAGTDAERRAAAWLRRQLDARSDGAGSRRTARLEPFWCRPNWALAHASHAGLGVVGSLVSRASPQIGAGLVLAALLSIVVDALTGLSLGRLLSRERASQNVVSETELEPPRDDLVHLVITANYDAGRCGLVHRDALRRPVAWLARASGRLAPGWLSWVCIALMWLSVVALLRAEGHGGTALDVIQLVPTVGLLLALALLLELATSDFSPAAGDNGSGVAAAIALGLALDAAPPHHMSVELVLQGAGDGEGIGLREYLRSRKHVRQSANTVALGFAACGGGRPRWWVSDGALIPCRYGKELRTICAAVAQEDAEPGPRPHRGRGHTPALRARWARLPAIALGCLDEQGVAARAHQTSDTPQAVSLEAIDQAVEFGLQLVDRLDAMLARRAKERITQA